MDDREARTALARVRLAPATIKPITGGWANWTFELDGELIVRFPRNDSVALGTHRELLLLPELAQAMSSEIPIPSHVATWRDRPFFVYRRIDGVPLSRANADQTVTEAIGHVLAELHAFPVERAAHLLRLGPPETVWLQRYQDLWQIVEDVALPEMSSELAGRVRGCFHEIVGDPPDFTPSLIHNDLGPEHVLVQRASPPTVALIDFEDASVGDPAVDLTSLVALLGTSAVPALVAGRDLGERLPERLWFYRWMGSVHAIIYGVTAGVEEERTGGLAELRRRLAARPHSPFGS